MNVFTLPCREFKVYMWICKLNEMDSFIEDGRKWTINSPENIAASCYLHTNDTLKTIYRLKQRGLVFVNETHSGCSSMSDMALSARCLL